jgi:hypothetical protein
VGGNSKASVTSDGGKKRDGIDADRRRRTSQPAGMRNRVDCADVELDLLIAGIARKP